MLKVSDLATPQFKANPHPFYARLRAENPVCRTTLFGQPTWLVTRYDDVVSMLRDERLLKEWHPATKWLFRFAGSITRHMLNRDPPDHTRLRTLVQKAFTPKLIEHLRGRIQVICDDLLNPLETSGRMDLMRDYALPVPLTIIAELLGIPPDDRLHFHSFSRSTISASSLVGALRSVPDQRFLGRNLRKLIAARRREPREDLITALVQAEEAGDKLSEDEVVAMIALLMLAGYETTVNLIGSGALALIQHPEQLEALQRNPGLADSAIEELLRYTSPLDVASQRFAGEELTIRSVDIKQGHLVVAMIGSANHDGSQFPDPEVLDLTRQPNKHVAFGQGAHFCLGASLARLEGQIALTTLFRRFPELQLAQPAESLRWRKSLVVRGLEELPLVTRVRNPLR
jgi:cytochrome P450